MELFLNLCWLSLLLPACLLWRRQRSSATGSNRPAARPLLFLCVLGCSLVLLFPVISASDDLHAMSPEMEESERALRHAGHCGCTIHALTHSAPPLLPSSGALTPVFEQIGNVFPFTPEMLPAISGYVPTGRAPPSDLSTSL
jgi:hypothetical protein